MQRFPCRPVAVADALEDGFSPALQPSDLRAVAAESDGEQLGRVRSGVMGGVIEQEYVPCVGALVLLSDEVVVDVGQLIPAEEEVLHHLLLHLRLLRNHVLLVRPCSQHKHVREPLLHRRLERDRLVQLGVSEQQVKPRKRHERFSDGWQVHTCRHTPRHLPQRSPVPVLPVEDHRPLLAHIARYDLEGHRSLVPAERLPVERPELLHAGLQQVGQVQQRPPGPQPECLLDRPGHEPPQPAEPDEREDLGPVDEVLLGPLVRQQVVVQGAAVLRHPKLVRDPVCSYQRPR
mmetsp:Transcript_9320/g.21269  ORF Transcript_9320/g.21269 Transcript_9320/m.21269 type:complete len:290 (+) Transcript_9320:173-1042(+)